MSHRAGRAVDIAVCMSRYRRGKATYGAANGQEVQYNKRPRSPHRGRTWRASKVRGRERPLPRNCIFATVYRTPVAVVRPSVVLVF